MTGGPCILCSGTDYARDCAAGQCAAQQMDLISDTPGWEGGNFVGYPAPGWFQDEEMSRYSAERETEWREAVCRSHLPAGRHDKGWSHA